MSLEEIYTRLREQIDQLIYGQDDAVHLALVALFSSGHVLLEGVPGTAKTLLVRTIASAIDVEYNRIQMTPDLLPADIAGSSIYREDNHSFEFVRGPVFTNFLLADELNRASARTQSALLEAMQELQVSYGGETHALPDPFVVFATQNPVEQEGTYPLPIAQLDRFMLKIAVDYPAPEAEELILKNHHATGGRSKPNAMGVRAVISPEEIRSAREVIRQTTVQDEVISYVRQLVHATRQEDSLSVGASPRAGLMLLMSAKSTARFAGRDYVTPDDVKAVFLPAMRHRVVLSPMAEMEGASTDNVLENMLDLVEVPR